jgi:hypothetical protein
VRYRIEVTTPISERVAGAFAPLELAPGGDGTVLEGDLEDQAALFAALARVRSLGLDLVSLTPSGGPGPVTPPGGPGR